MIGKSRFVLVIFKSLNKIAKTAGKTRAIKTKITKKIA
jgi:hypothetical protein